MPYSSTLAKQGATERATCSRSALENELMLERRHFSSYLRNLPNAHGYLLWFARAMGSFRRPAALVAHYLRQTSPKSGLVEMRDGTRVRLSGHPHDIITLFVVFLRQDYGQFPGMGTVVDVGANLGAFSLFAARQGAKAVIAFEPNSTAFDCMDRNIRENALETRVRVRRLAVTSTAGKLVRFPAAASAYNRILKRDEAGDYEVVRTTNLAEIIANCAPGGIDLLKLDCEGAEYDILSAPDAPLEQVREIRMEYHAGCDELVKLLHGRGFRITRLSGDEIGMLWARRVSEPVL